MDNSIGGTLAVIVVLLFLVGGAFNVYATFADEHVAHCTVTSKDRSLNSDGKSSARIYTRECGVLANEDSFLRGKFNSADVQGQLEEGKAYDIRVAGLRIPFISEFPNILEVK